MKKSEQIIILKAKVIKLKEQLKAARLELADRDNKEIGYIGEMEFNPIESTEGLFNNPISTMANQMQELSDLIKLGKEIKDRIVKEHTKDNSAAFIQKPITPTKENIDYDYGG